MRRTIQLLLVASIAAPLSAMAAGGPDEAVLLSNVRQITFEGRRAGEGYFGPAGRKFVFQSEREDGNPFFQIYLLDLETGDVERLSPGWGKTTCSWIHPSGDRVVFASTHDDPDARRKQTEELQLRETGRQRRYAWDYDEYFNIYEINLQSKELRSLTTARGYDAEGSWSADGEWIVFSSNRHIYERLLSAREEEIFSVDKSYFVDIYLMRKDGSELKRLTTTNGYDGGPFFSPDGQKITWRRFSEDGATAEIFMMNRDGTDQRQMTDLGAMSWAPFFHPSGEYLLFATNLHGFSNFELYMVDVDGRQEPVRVTETDGFDGLPAFAPDGKRLAWTSTRAGGGSQIFFANWNHEYARKLLQLDKRPPTKPALTSEDLRVHVDYLASERLEGRRAGERGERLAAEYAAGVFKSLGLEPFGDDDSYSQEFEFTSGVSLGTANELVLEIDGKARRLELGTDWRPIAFSKTGDVAESDIVFAGYGIVAPEEGTFPEYDSYAHFDVRDKWVVVFRFEPEEISPEYRQHLAVYANLRYKAMAARERGARGILVASGSTSKVDQELVKLRFDSSAGTSGLAAVSISDRLAADLVRLAGKQLHTLQQQLDTGEPMMGFSLAGARLRGRIDIRQEKKRARNVLARLKSGRQDVPAVVVGAHYDHLGRNPAEGSRATAEEREAVHYGADDNASGSAGVLELAEYFATQKTQGRLGLARDIIFALWSGEELGLLGSNYFASSYDVDGNDQDLTAEVAAYINMDMIGRLREKLILQGIGSSTVWPTEVERRNVPVRLAVTTQNDSYLPTDVTSFYLKKVPVLSAFTGLHDDYHSPGDTAEKLNYEGMVQVLTLLSLITRSIATRDEAPEYVEMERPATSVGRTRMRAYLGTIPDYAQGDVEGVKLSGVAAGGPAEKAGLQPEDIIVELAGRSIKNIYDYTYAIDALKVGETVKIVVVREGKRLEVQLTPGSRN